MTVEYPKYRKGSPPLIVRSADGKTTIEVFRRADGDWGTTTRRGGRKVSTNGEGVQRVRALAQAKREAGPGAKVIEARHGPRGTLVPV